MTGSYCAPSLLIGLINMFMLKKRDVGFVDGAGKEHDSCYLDFWYPNQVLIVQKRKGVKMVVQATIEHTLLLLAALSVPVMLLGKPLHHLWKHRKDAVDSASSHHSGEVREMRETW